MTTLRKHEYTVIVESPGLRPVLVSVTLSSGTTDIATLHDRIVASHSKRYPTRPSIRFAASDKDGGHVLVDSTGRTVVPRGKVHTPPLLSFLFFPPFCWHKIYLKKASVS